jgi:hypothetical protein
MVFLYAQVACTFVENPMCEKKKTEHRSAAHITAEQKKKNVHAQKNKQQRK